MTVVGRAPSYRHRRERFLKPNPVSTAVGASMLIRYNVRASIETAASSCCFWPRSSSNHGSSRNNDLCSTTRRPTCLVRCTEPLDQDRTLITATNQRRCTDSPVSRGAKGSSLPARPADRPRPRLSYLFRPHWRIRPVFRSADRLIRGFIRPRGRIAWSSERDHIADIAGARLEYTSIVFEACWCAVPSPHQTAWFAIMTKDKGEMYTMTKFIKINPS